MSCLSGYVFVFMVMIAGVVDVSANQSADPVANVLQGYPGNDRLGLRQALDNAGTNRTEMIKALESAAENEHAEISFLVRNMPKRDLVSLSSEFLLENVRLARKARLGASWGESVSDELYLNDVLPYVSLNERRDNWRADFYKRFAPLVADCKTPAEAALILNRDVYRIFHVRYHATKRRKPDQSPYESIELGYASCTGLSILLVDACRAVGVPARVAGTPCWTTRPGNHSWVEVWSEGKWHFVGAAESSKLNDGWFLADAAAADPAKMEHRIYASSFKKTGLYFPMVWAWDIRYVSAVDVTAFYHKFADKTKVGGADAEQKAMTEAEKKLHLKK
jgi:transglutaminase-like putative cysteine protease